MNELSRAAANSTMFRPRPDGDIDPAGEAGWFLQRARENAGISVEEAGETCGIHPHHLAAIECGDLTRLPPRTEALNMIGHYASYLNFEPEPLVLHYARFLPSPIPVRQVRGKVKPKPLGSAKIISFPLARRFADMAAGTGGIVASVLVSVILFGGASWMLAPSVPSSENYIQVSANEPAAPAAPAVDEQTDGGRIVSSIGKLTEEALADDKSGPALSLEQQADKSAAQLTGLAELIQSQLDGEAAAKNAAPAEPPAPKKKPVASAPVPEVNVARLPTVDQAAPKDPGQQSVAAPEGRVYGSENRNARLVLTARSSVWVRIEDREGNVVMTQVLRQGESYRVPDRPDLIIIARDGGQISYSVDGVHRGELGEPGEILVGRPLDLERLTSRAS